MNIIVLFVIQFAVCFSFGFENQNVSEEDSFQLRRLYYSNKESVCTTGDFYHRATKIIFQFTFDDGRQTIVDYDNYGGVGCFSLPILPGSMSVSQEIFYLPQNSSDLPNTHPQYAIFKQQQIVVKVFGVLGIWANVTGISQAKFNNEPFDCVVKGDGTEQHFYVEGFYQPPVLRAHCTKKTNETAELNIK